MIGLTDSEEWTQREKLRAERMSDWKGKTGGSGLKRIKRRNGKMNA